MNALKLPWKGKDVPAALLDVVRGCNCICRACFNRRPPSHKPLGTIREELAAIQRLRNVKSVGITGGEPLLHPQIADVVRLIRDRGLSPAMLTNGILWNADVADRLRRAGLDTVMFHIQPGQTRPDLRQEATAADAFALISEKCATAAASGVEAVAIATVSARRPQETDAMLDAFLGCRECSYLWLTLERDMQTIGSGRESSARGNGIEEMSGVLLRHGWRPFAGIGGSIDASRWRWMAFHSFARIDRAGHVAGLASVPPSLFERGAFAALRLIGVQLPYRVKASRAGILGRIAANAVSGGPVKNLGFVLAALAGRQRIEPKHVVVEALPELAPDGRIEHCDPCIDATVRDGRLVPPCLADVDCEV